MNRLTLLSILIAAGIIAAAFTFSGERPAPDTASENNVSIVDGVQIVEIGAKGGYSPRQSVAAAGIPTLVRFVTNGTFDCSSIVRIPSLDVTENLPASGSLDIDIGTPEKGLFRGSCGMGMYPFEIDFQ